MALAIERIKEGNGQCPKVGNRVTVHYVGYINGRKFDSTYDREQPFSFHLGKGEVISAWDQLVPKMSLG